MNRFLSAIEMIFFFGITGFLAEIIGSIKTSYIILLVLVTIDTIAGIIRAIKLRKFSSSGLLKLSKKVILYTITIMTVRLLEMSIDNIFKTTMLSQIMTAYLNITEAISILENLTFLGAPIPSNIIHILTNTLNLPWLNTALENRKNNELNISEIDDIIKYQLPTFDNDCVRKMLQIKFEVWKSIAEQINYAFEDNDTDNKDLIYFKVMSLIEMGFKEREEKWKEEDIPEQCIKQFMKWHQPQIDKWLLKVKTICYTDEPLTTKKEQIIDSIIVFLYQTVVNARKSLQ
jgi:toxin secretion/phage lysis holin